MVQQKDLLDEIRRHIVEPRPPAPKPPEKFFEYNLSLISYFDILGMRVLLASAGGDAQKVANILQIARRFSQPDTGAAENFGWTFVNFSDLILRTVPVASEVNRKYRLGVVFQELSDLGHIQVNLLAKDVLIRGALTLGNITVDRDLVFGPALARAYELESRTAVFPRIIIDPIVLKSLKESALLRAHDYNQEMEYIRRLVKKDADGAWFVDYLGYVLDNADDNWQYGKFLLHHRTVVQAQLRESYAMDGRTREGRSRRTKATWLRKYHNRHIRTLSARRLKEETGITKNTLFI